MADIFGHSVPQVPFRDIRNTRPSIAEEKAMLALDLIQLCKRVPPFVLSGSIQTTRHWRRSQEQALKTAASPRASVGDLRGAISTMNAFWERK